MDCDPKYLIEISSLEFTVFNRMVQFFSEPPSTVFLYFTKGFVAISSSKDTAFILEEHLQP